MYQIDAQFINEPVESVIPQCVSLISKTVPTDETNDLLMVEAINTWRLRSNMTFS